MADEGEKRASKRQSEFNSQRASHGSASDDQNQPPPDSANPLTSFGYNLRNLNEVASPAPAAFYDEARIRRNTSLEDEREKDRSKDKSAIRPKPEQRGLIPGPSTPKTPPNPNQEGEYSTPESYENLDEVATPSPVENRSELALYRHTTLEERRKSVQARSSSRRAKTRTKKRKDGSKSPSSSGVINQNGSPAPGSSGKEDATALPQYAFSQENLEEQLAAARLSHRNNSSQVIQTSSPHHRGASRFATKLYTVSYLIFFSILGTLARLGVQWLTFYPGAPVVISVLWANFGGSLIFGILSEDRRLFREEWSSHSPSSPSFGMSREKLGNGREQRSEDDPEAVASHSRVKKTIPLYIGLATGFCGSFTSFSSFMRDAFLSLANNLPTPDSHPYPSGFPSPASTTTIHRNGGYSFLATVAIILLTLSLSLSALKIGAHIAIAFDPWTPTISFTFLRKFLDRIIVVLAFGCWLGATLMCIWPPDRPGGPSGRSSWSQESWRSQALFACVFAPLGCLTRFYISLWLNPVSPSFPLGTFTVNIFGTVVEAMSFDLQHVSFASTIGGGRVSCQVLQGVMDGYCGCLTTVSTFVGELQGLKRSHSYVYGSTSVLGGLAMVVAVMGGVRWGVGWEEAVCAA